MLNLMHFASLFDFSSFQYLRIPLGLCICIELNVGDADAGDDKQTKAFD